MIAEFGQFQRSQLYYPLALRVYLYYGKAEYDRSRINADDAIHFGWRTFGRQGGHCRTFTRRKTIRRTAKIRDPIQLPTKGLRKVKKIFFSPQWRKWGMRALTIGILSIFCWQFWRLHHQLDWQSFRHALARPGNWRFLLFTLLAMFLNWSLEAWKWHLLLRVFLPWSFGRTLRTTLAGVSLSAATPNRIGEIGGRLLVAARPEWAGVLTSSLIGSACQWIAFLLLAWPGLMWTADGLLRDQLPFPPAWLWPLGPLLLVIGFASGKVLLLRLLAGAEKRYGIATASLESGIADVKFPLILRVGAIACARFVVYCTQLWWLLSFFGLELPYLEGVAGIAGIYLVQAGIPLPPGLNLVTRTELGLLLWGATPAAAMATLAAYTSLFTINVLLPALPGYWLVIKKR